MRIPHSTANNQVLLSWVQTQQAVQNATGNSMASLAKPAGAYHVSHMEFTATGNKAAGSEATRFPRHGRVSIVYGAEHPECLKSVQRHQFVVTQCSIAVRYIQPISFLLLWCLKRAHFERRDGKKQKHR